MFKLWMWMKTCWCRMFGHKEHLSGVIVGNNKLILFCPRCCEVLAGQDHVDAVMRELVDNLLREEMSEREKHNVD